MTPVNIYQPDAFKKKKTLISNPVCGKVCNGPPVDPSK
jgi:hypothetical protein